MGTCRMLAVLARDVGRMAADRNATQRRAANDQKSVESMHRAGRLPATTGETVNIQHKNAVAAEPTGKSRVVPDAIGNLHHEAGKLFENLLALADRLDPVRKNRNLGDEVGPDLEPTGVLVADQIWNVTERLRSMDSLVSVLLIELEV